jgi:hypothetical protein
VRPGSTAWNEERFAQMHDALWSAFELEERYEELERRLGYITDTIKYALDVAKDNKTLHLERLIVALISAELLISVMHTGILAPVASAVMDLFAGAGGTGGGSGAGAAAASSAAGGVGGAGVVGSGVAK